ncbi:MAG: hypothetical protein COB39_12725 [Marinosulfonomonas sp.]|nr:MAG: hypothetical protein COB39_12725 [Marinosulfonomonas sp.]
MATDGLNFTCSTCHVTDQHQWAGSRYDVLASDPHGTGKPGERRDVASCESCHGNEPHPVGGNPLLIAKGMTLNDHTDKIACQTCHIPEFARGGVATKTLWDWSTAGQMDDGKIIKRHEYTQADGKELHTYLSTKGDFEWGEDVVPFYSWFNGQLEYTLADDTIDPSKTVEINRIGGALGEEGARIWPITHMVAPAADALDCQSCHAKDGRLEGLTGFYMPGRDPFSYVGMLGMLMVVGTLLGVLTHALLRKFVKKDGGSSHE